jgi:hypothetical protein
MKKIVLSINGDSFFMMSSKSSTPRLISSPCSLFLSLVDDKCILTETTGVSETHVEGFEAQCARVQNMKRWKGADNH